MLASALCSAVGPLDKMEVEGQLGENKHDGNVLASAPFSAVGPLDKMEGEGQLGENKHNGKGWLPLRAVPLDVVRNQTTVPCSAVEPLDKNWRPTAPCSTI